MEDSARILGQLNPFEGGSLHRAFDLVDRSIEAALIDLKGRFLGLADLLDDLLVAGAQLVVTMGLLLDDGAVLVVLAEVGGNVTEDAQLGDIGVVLGIDTFKFRVKGSVAGAGQAGIALVDLDVRVTLLEVDEVVSSFLYISQI